jgi:phosphatidylserine decarboxylase
MDFTSLYNLPALLMRHLTPNSRLPPPRHAHASAATDAGIVVVGGEGIVLADGR